MMFYEYHVHPEVDLGGMLDNLSKLGWGGACLICDSLEQMEKIRKSIKTGLDISLGYRIKTEKPSVVVKLARKMRKKAEVILVNGGDTEINRKACETPEVDILTHPGLDRKDSGLDYVMAKFARENNVAVEFSFRELLLSYKISRSRIFSGMLENAKLVRKYKTPFTITSGAVDPLDMRSPSDLISLGRILGLDPKRVKSSLSDWIVKENRKRLDKKWIMPGVEIE